MNFQCIIPQRFYSERLYALQQLLEQTFYCDLLLQSADCDAVTLIFEKKSIVLKDSFFNTTTNYLDKQSWPNNLEWFQSKACGLEVPLLFGRTQTNSTTNTLTIEADYIASTFFMLARIEEYQADSSCFDEFGRFKAECSLAGKHNFLKLPIVDVYALELAYYINQHFGIQLKKRTTFTVQATCDVDFIEKWPTFGSKIKSLVGDLVKRKSFNRFKQTLSEVLKGKNPFNTFEYLEQLADKHAVELTYYWLIGGGENPLNNHNYLQSDLFKETVNRNKAAGRTMGLHPALGSTQNIESLKKQLITLKAKAGIKVTRARQHYLQSTFPELWQRYFEVGLQHSSNSYYSEALGFRSGTTLTHATFNCATRTILPVYEEPLSLMDVTLLNLLNTSNLTEVQAEVQQLIKTIQQVEGTFTFLWHNHTIHTHEWQELQGILVDLFACKKQ